MHLDVRIGDGKRLGIGVDGDKLDAADALLDHTVHGVGAAAAHANNLNHGEIVAGDLGVLHRFLLVGGGPVPAPLLVRSCFAHVTFFVQPPEKRW